MMEERENEEGREKGREKGREEEKEGEKVGGKTQREERGKRVGLEVIKQDDSELRCSPTFQLALQRLQLLFVATVLLLQQ